MNPFEKTMYFGRAGEMNLAEKLMNISKNREEKKADSAVGAEDKLSQIADPKCSKCYGRGYTGKDIIHKAYVVCTRCLSKYQRKQAKEEADRKETREENGKLVQK